MEQRHFQLEHSADLPVFRTLALYNSTNQNAHSLVRRMETININTVQ